MSHLFGPNDVSLVFLLKPVFAEDGTNERTYQNKVYSVFLKYLRETGSKYFQ